MEITIRKATIDDAEMIAQIVAMAIGDVDTLKNYCGESYIEALKEIARLKESQYSYNNAFIAEVDGISAGAVVGYDGGLLNHLRSKTLSVINKYNPNFVVKEDETQKGEYYLDSLGVLPEYRGLGVAKKLLMTLQDYAFKEHHPCVGLLVDYENPKAEKLYQSLGFKRINTRDFLGHKMWHLQKKAMKSFGQKPWVLPQPVLIIGTYNNDGTPNAMNAAWGGQWDAKEIMISMGSHATTENLARCNEFTVAFATKETMVASDFVGMVSAKNDPQKIQKTGWTAIKSENVNAPVFSDFPMTLECRILRKIDESEEGYYIIAEIVNILVDENYLDESGKPEVGKMQFITYEPIHHGYHVIGERVGNAFADGKQLK